MGCTSVTYIPNLLLMGFRLTVRVQRGRLLGHELRTPATGTAQFLTLVDPFVPDDFINQHWNHRPSRGPHRSIALHNSVASTCWPAIAGAFIEPCSSCYRNNGPGASSPACPIHSGPDVRMLHEFRARSGVSGFRAINHQLRLPWIERAAGWSRAVALIDATDLPAACGGFKKKQRKRIPPIVPPWAGARSRRGKVVGLSATKSTRSVCGDRNIAPGVMLVPLVSWATPANVRRRTPGAQPAPLPAAMVVVAADSWRTWGIWRPKPNAGAASAGRSRS